MKAISKVVQADKAGYTLRTSIPSQLAEKMKIKVGDYLEWELKDSSLLIKLVA